MYIIDLNNYSNTIKLKHKIEVMRHNDINIVQHVILENQKHKIQIIRERQHVEEENG